MDTFGRVLSEFDSSRSRAAAQAREYKSRQAAFEAEYCARQRPIDEFLTSCHAVPCPIEVYAVWLAVWISQGGKITHSHTSDFGRKEWMMPTQSTNLAIPTGYGAQALMLVVLSELTSIPDTPTSEWRSRKGWEWGHGHALRLSSSMTGMGAATNQADAVSSYPDVEDCIRSFGPRLLAQRARDVVSGVSLLKAVQR